MNPGLRPKFPLVEEFSGIHLDANWATVEPGRTTVIESPRRLRHEQSYSFIHGLWWVWLDDGRSVASVPPGAGRAVRGVVAGALSAEARFDPGIADALKRIVDETLLGNRLSATDRKFCDLCFACDASLLGPHGPIESVRLIDDSLPPADGLNLPVHCFPDGIVYGVVVQGAVVSIAYAHRTGVMEGKVADLAVETASAWRKRGFARAAVRGVVEHVVKAGGEAHYSCKPGNLASAATARSVGFVSHAKSLILSAPAKDAGPE